MIAMSVQSKYRRSSEINRLSGELEETHARVSAKIADFAPHLIVGATLYTPIVDQKTTGGQTYYRIDQHLQKNILNGLICVGRDEVKQGKIVAVDGDWIRADVTLKVGDFIRIEVPIPNTVAP